MLLALLILTVTLILLCLYSLGIGSASMIDIFGGLGLVTVGWILLFAGEDYRYRSWRELHGDRGRWHNLKARPGFEAYAKRTPAFSPV